MLQAKLILHKCKLTWRNGARASGARASGEKKASEAHISASCRSSPLACALLNPAGPGRRSIISFAYTACGGWGAERDRLVLLTRWRSAGQVCMPGYARMEGEAGPSFVRSAVCSSGATH